LAATSRLGVDRLVIVVTAVAQLFDSIAAFAESADAVARLVVDMVAQKNMPELVASHPSSASVVLPSSLVPQQTSQLKLSELQEHLHSTRVLI
jgi:hypothetical protein